MDKRQELERVARLTAKTLQDWQREEGSPVTSDEESEKAIQKFLNAELGTQSEAEENRTN